MKFGVPLICLSLCTSAAGAEPIACDKGQCDLLNRGAYSSVIVGTVDHIGTDDEMKAVYQWASKHRYWKNLPKGEQAYLRAANMIALAPPQADTFAAPSAVLMGRDEFNSAAIYPGDLVRYAPHRKDHEAPKGDATYLDVYWKATGCVLILCRAGDGECMAKFKPGVYARANGTQVDAKTGQPIAGGTVVDTMTWMPVKPPAAHP